MTASPDAAAMADFLEADDHDRPFFRDREFVDRFGRAHRSDLTAAVEELKRRAEVKAQTAGVQIAWPANLPSPEIERITT